MINRVLIRMKTVQLLYSYLLVEKKFALESQPSSPTKEKRFAYNLYLDLILLIDKLAHQIVGKYKKFPLAETKFVLKTENDEKILSLKNTYLSQNYPFTSTEDILKDLIQESLLFRNFEKNREEGLMTDNFWENVFNSIIIVNPNVNTIIQSLPGYSLSGVERMKNLMQITFSNFYSSKDNIDDALRTLEKSMYQARELYMRLLALPVELTRLRLDQLELGRQKLLVTHEDLNPNMKFVDNILPAAIERNKDFSDYIEKNHISWLGEDPDLLRLLLKEILNSDIYTNYLNDSKGDVKKDIDFWRDIFVEVILNNKDFLEYLENKSVFWNDDIEIIGSFVLKTFKRFENHKTESEAVMPMYKDGENGKDARFGAELFNFVVRNRDLYRKYIEDALSHEKWDADRLAFMDFVITMTALAEIINYPEIPLQVSINEYIEIAKSYSSEKSGQFVNGLLASILPKLKEDKLTLK